MVNKIIELKCIDCVSLDRNQFIASFNSIDNEKYQMTFHENKYQTKHILPYDSED
jgi:hypothetical protein